MKNKNWIIFCVFLCVFFSIGTNVLAASSGKASIFIEVLKGYEGRL